MTNSSTTARSDSPGPFSCSQASATSAAPETVALKISQETLAEMVGTTRSRVSSFMNEFRSLGYVDYGKSGLHVHRSLLNVVLR